MTVSLPYSPLPGAEQPGSLAEAAQADLDELALRVDSGFRRVAGSVDTTGTGTITAGTGFTISRLAVGRVTITWDTPFPAAPFVQVTGGPSPTVMWVSVRAKSGGVSVTVQVSSTAGADTDGPFDFLASN